jgi:hypothetical protein
MLPNRRQALECMVWTGAAALWTVTAGAPRASLFGSAQSLKINRTWK